MNSTKLIVAFSGVAILAGCNNLNRSMVFSTGTTGGIELKTIDQTGQPGNIIIGYKRAEVLFDPIIEDDNSIREEAHSVIAKLAGSAGAGNSATGSVSQWFASGEAAKLLAKSGMVPLTDNSAVAESLAESRFAVGIAGEHELPDYALNAFQDLAAGLRKSSNAGASKLADKLDKSEAVSAFIPSVGVSFERYVISGVQKNLTKNAQVVFKHDFDQLIEYYRAVKQSRDNLVDFHKNKLSWKGTPYASLTVAAKKELAIALGEMELKEEQMRERIIHDGNIIEVMNAIAGN